MHGTDTFIAWGMHHDADYNWVQLGPSCVVTGCICLSFIGMQTAHDEVCVYHFCQGRNALLLEGNIQIRIFPITRRLRIPHVPACSISTGKAELRV